MAKQKECNLSMEAAEINTQQIVNDNNESTSDNKDAALDSLSKPQTFEIEQKE
jgi:hypothetical protein